MASIIPTVSAARGLTFLNSNLRQTGEGERRLHPALDAVVAGPPVRSGQNTVITFAPGTDIRSGTSQGTGTMDSNSRLRVLVSQLGVPVGPDNRPEPRCPWDGIPALPVASDGTKLGPVKGAAGWVPISCDRPNNTITVRDPDGKLMDLRAGDLVRVATTVHADLAIQTVSNPSNRAPNPENILIQDVQGYAAGFQIFLMQTRWQTTRDGSLTAGSSTSSGTAMTSSGTSVTFAPDFTHGLRKGHELRITSGPQAGESWVVEASTGSNTLTLRTPFSVDQTTGVNWSANFAPDLSSNGTTVTFTDPHGCVRWSGLTLTGGAQAGETRFIETVVDDFTLIIDAPFSANQAGTQWACRRSTKDVAWVNFLADSGAPPRDNDFQIGQLEPCGINWIMINCTIPGKSAGGGSVSFTGFGGTADNSRWRHLFFADNLFRRLSAGDPQDSTQFPVAAQWKGGNNYYMTGRNWDTRTPVPAGSEFWLQNLEPPAVPNNQEIVGSITERWDTLYRPPAVMNRTHTAGVLMPFDVHQRPRTASSPVGAVAARPCI